MRKLASNGPALGMEAGCGPEQDTNQGSHTAAGACQPHHAHHGHWAQEVRVVAAEMPLPQAVPPLATQALAEVSDLAPASQWPEGLGGHPRDVGSTQALSPLPVT